MLARSLLCLMLSIPSSSALATTQPSSSVRPPTIQTPVVICPGFGNDQIDYVEPLQQSRTVGFVSALERRGFDPNRIYIVPVQRTDWLRVAGGLFDLNFYTNNALPTGNGYGWYLKRLKDCVDRAHVESDGERVLVIGHSAGGWLARAVMGDGTWCPMEDVRTSERVRGLVTVGAIHRPPDDVGTCVTRGALAFTDRTYPGAFLAEEGVAYVSVGGDAIVGSAGANDDDDDDVSEADRVYAVRGEGSSSKVAFTSYEAVCGVGEGVTGDGVVPLDWTQLDGARQVKLDGVLHSINEAGTTLPTDRWYGSEGVIDRWLPAALEEAGIRAGGCGNDNGFDLFGLQRWAVEQAAAAQRVLQSR